MNYSPRCILCLGAAVGLALSINLQPAWGQDRLKTMPGYEQYQKMSAQLPGAIKSGAVAVTWKDGGKSLEYQTNGKLFRYDIAAKKMEELGPAKTPPDRPGPGLGGRPGGGGGGRFPPGGVGRGRQVASAPSPDGKLKATYRDRNLYLSDAKGGNEVAVTTDG